MSRTTMMLLAALVALSGCSDHSADLEQSNIEVVKRWHDEIWSKGDLSVMDEIVADDYVKHWAAFPATVGREALKAHVARWRNSFPDWREDVDAIDAAGDMVFVRWTESGTFSADLPYAAATNRQGEVAGMGWLRLKEARLLRNGPSSTIGAFRSRLASSIRRRTTSRVGIGKRFARNAPDLFPHDGVPRPRTPSQPQTKVASRVRQWTRSAL